MSHKASGSRQSSEKGHSPSRLEAAPARRQLTLFDGISTIISLMVGSGIFSTSGTILAYVGSTGLSLVLWTVTGLLSLTGALCYAELGTMIPGSGGEAQYLEHLGRIAVFLFNWTSIIILKPGTVAILSVATAKYLLRILFTFTHPNDAFGGFSQGGYDWLVKGVAMGVCVIVTLASALSTKWSNRIQSVLTFGKIGALGLIIFSSIYYVIFVDTEIAKQNLGAPFAGSLFAFGKFAEGMNEGLWAFEGWNNLNIVAGDLINPSVNLPLSIWSSMISVVSLYLLTLIGYYCVLPAKLIISSADLGTIGIDFGIKIFGHAGAIIMSVLIASSTFSSALSSMVTSSEIVVLAAKTGQLPKFFAGISTRFGTAARAYWLQCVLSCIMVTMSGFKTLVMIYTFPTWIFYAACVLVLLKLRWTAPHLARPYKVYITTPILFLIACAWLTGTSFYADWFPVGMSLVVVLTGIPAFYLFNYLFGGEAPKGEKSQMSEVKN